ncbi:MAG: LutB/LldF family L-lactate oxidation iron-sulfur protein [Bacteroidota bacterium]|nr:LutB/LldF family L-lactate oxidation iron-sulfur protein [Bacteroidota bacterium]
MSEEIYNKFILDSEIKSFDENHRKTLNFNISRYDIAVENGKKQYANLDLAKQRAEKIKNKAIDELEKLLIEFEANFSSRGGKVIWAEDSDIAIDEINKILVKHSVKNVVKSKSMTTEEIELNEELKKQGVNSFETDLGEYIVQLAGEKPYHIVTPCMHKSKEDIALLFNEKFNRPKDSTPEEITAFVRNVLREKFISAEAGITGANFLIADIGAVALTENEGNGLMSISFPKVHIAIVGIEKIIPSMKDLDLFWPLLATHGTGQNVTVYNSIISGPRLADEIDGPEEMYVILLDNRRTEILKKVEQRRALSCIRCGACLNNCPVYKSIGGHSYGSTYSGPIGSVITPFLKGMEDYKHLSFASSLCGKCSSICPVRINIHKLLLYNRRDIVNSGLTKKSDRVFMFAYKKAMTNRWLLDLFGSKWKNYALNKFFKNLWGPRRELPVVKEKSFRKIWKEGKL